MPPISKLTDLIVTVRRGAKAQQRRPTANPAQPREAPPPPPPSAASPKPTPSTNTCTAFDFLAEVQTSTQRASASTPPPSAAASAPVPAEPTRPPEPEHEAAFRLKRPSLPPMLHTRVEPAPSDRPLPPTSPDATPHADTIAPAPIAPEAPKEQLSLLDYTPPTPAPQPLPPPAPTPDTTPTHPALTLEDVTVAVGRAVDTLQQRRTSDALELLLTAQREEIALFTQADRDRNERFVQALLEARTDYREHLELAVTRILEELADGTTIPAALGQLADSVGAHFRRTERMHEKLLLELRELTTAVKSTAERTEALLHIALARPAAEPARLLTLVPSAAAPTNRPAPGQILEKLDDEDDDDLDVGQETHA